MLKQQLLIVSCLMTSMNCSGEADFGGKDQDADVIVAAEPTPTPEVEETTEEQVPIPVINFTSNPEIIHTVFSIPKGKMRLDGTLRDFREEHEDFEPTNYTGGVITGIVKEDLSQDGKPELSETSTAESITSAETFAQWYRDIPDVNQALTHSIELKELEDQPGVYSYANSAFFPLDDQLFGNEGNPHNYHFTFEIHSEFTYSGGEKFSFTGDDDVWVYINNKLVVDLGNLHGATNGSVALDDLDLEIGKTYDFAMFFAERKLTQSNFRIDTTLALKPNQPYEYQATTDYGEAGKKVDYSVTTGPKDLTIDPQTGLVKWNPGEADAGIHKVVIQAIGEDGATGLQEFDIEMTIGK
jgi:fibro-slime domain-containing protein